MERNRQLYTFEKYSEMIKVVCNGRFLTKLLRGFTRWRNQRLNEKENNKCFKQAAQIYSSIISQTREKKVLKK